MVNSQSDELRVAWRIEMAGAIDRDDIAEVAWCALAHDASCAVPMADRRLLGAAALGDLMQADRVREVGRAVYAYDLRHGRSEAWP